MKKILSLFVLLSFISLSVKSYYWVGEMKKKTKSVKEESKELCEAPKSSSELALNNVRALIHTGGDMWWDLQSTSRYEVPIGSGKTALFAGSIWIGGLESDSKQLKVAAQRFRASGNDFWTGPLRGGDAYTYRDRCLEYDKHFKISRAEVLSFRTWFEAGKPSGYDIPKSILNWPALNPFNEDEQLAPFKDVDGDGDYDPEGSGDYPLFDLDRTMSCDASKDLRIPRLYGDETMWWVYNDNGNIHTESKGTKETAIGMEIRGQAFAFTSNDEINDATFYNYRLINRSSFTLEDCYFGVWTDADMGYAFDDYVGCDVKRGLGYLYNGKDFDGKGGEEYAYGDQPPAIGIDFFEGPYMDAYTVKVVTDSANNIFHYDTLDRPDGGCDESKNGLNFGDSIANNERWGMRRFIYFNNGGGNLGDPESYKHYYNYLTGKWKDGTNMFYGGNGYYTHVNATQYETDFMFPGNTDPCGWGQKGGNGGSPLPMPEIWTEELEGTDPEDRRFVQSAGPFTLEPGASNDITIGAVWARASSGGAYASVEAVKIADDKAQRLFDECFKIVEGPDAPKLEIIEMNQKLIFHVIPEKGSNNYKDTPEDYREKNSLLVCPYPEDSVAKCDTFFENDVYYEFQGYQVFQLFDDETSISDIRDSDGSINEDKARLVFQCDKKDNIDKLVNYTWNDKKGAFDAAVMVDGSNNGITHSFELKDDAFATGETRIVNNKKYYFVAIAYAHNEYKHYSQSDPNTVDGQKSPYLSSRKGYDGKAIKIYETIPHIASVGGVILSADYGDGPTIEQIEGYGNGGNILELTDETIDEIMSGEPWKVENPKYKNGYGPINVTIVDPLNVPDGEFLLKFTDVDDVSNEFKLAKGYINSASWEVIITKEDGTEEVIKSFNTIENDNEQIVPEIGMSINIKQTNTIGYYEGSPGRATNAGVLSSGNSMVFEDNSKMWMSFYGDVDGNPFTDWIKAGKIQDTDDDDYFYVTADKPIDAIPVDPDGVFETVLGGIWAPYRLAGVGAGKPAYEITETDYNTKTYLSLNSLSSVNIVITSDKSKWTRSPVVEMCDNDENQVDGINTRSVGGAQKFDLRKSPSVDKNGNTINTGAGIDNSDYISETGMGWFPGYAIDVRTGERLNIIFGEDSWLPGENGRDMIWNPYKGSINKSGKHYIYIVGNNSKFEGQGLLGLGHYDAGQKIITAFAEGKKNEIYKNIMWTAMPAVIGEYYELNENKQIKIHSDLTIKLRVANPYEKAYGSKAKSSPKNGNFPMYRFNTNNTRTIRGDKTAGESALDLIKLVPNPYYGYSEYERSQLDNLVKITNLPNKCVISIYTVNGQLIRRFDKDNSSTIVEWDLKNSHGIQISGGLYLIYIKSDEYGEKILKWFGALRPTDLNSF